MGQETRIRVECDELPDDVQLFELEGREAISEGFDFDVMVASREPMGPPAHEVVGATAHIVFETNVPRADAPSILRGEERWYEVRRLRGIVRECDDILIDDLHTTYRMRVVPALWQCTLIETIDVFLELSIPDIIRKKMGMLQMVEGEDFELRIDPAHYPVREFVVQYKETDYAFLSRLCEHYGVFFFHERRGEEIKLVFADHNDACTANGALRDVPFRPGGERLGVFELQSKARLTPRVFIQRDYNYRTPQADLTAMANDDDGFAGGVVEYGGHFKDEQQGKRLAEIRAQEHGCGRSVLTGKSSEAELGAGTAWNLVGHPRGDRRLLVTEVLHHARQATFLHDGSDDVRRYHNDFRAVPFEVAFRPARVTPRPRVSGFLTGIIDGAASGQYAEVDDQGRYRVKFMFDTNETTEGKASSVVRMMQPHAGAGYGMHFPLRVGTEVLVTFFDGDPDRPIIAGTAPNPLTASPVNTTNATHNVIRTGGGNEIDIADDEDNQRVKITSPFGTSVVQIGQSNEPENGVALATMNNVSTTADGSVNAVTTVQTSWNSFNDTWSCHITDYAGPTTPLARLSWGIDAFKAVAVMVGDVTGGVLAIRDGIVTQKKLRLPAVLDDLDAKTAARDEQRVALTTCLGAVDETSLDADDRARLAALRAAMTDYETSEATLSRDRQAAAALAADEATLQTEKDELVAGRTWVDTKEAEIAAKQTAIDAKQAEITTAKATVEASEADRTAKKAALDAALDAVKADGELGSLSCGQGRLGDEAESFQDANDARLKAETKAENLSDEIASAEDSLDGAQETKDWADGLVAATDSITSPLFSLVTSIWGTGMQGLARNVADFMLEEALAQYGGITPAYIPSPKMQFDITAPPLFIKLEPPLPQQRPVEFYKEISRLDWATPFRTSTQMVPGGGAGMLGAGKTALLALIPVAGPFLAFRYSSKQQGAFQEARNLQGSEAHSVLFGQTSALVSGQEHAALTSAKKVVVTANDQVEVHARGKTEIAGGDAVYVTSAKAVEVFSRGDVLIKATGPADVVSADGVAARYLTDIDGDKDRAKLHMNRGTVELAACHTTSGAMLAELELKVADATNLGTATLQTGTGNQFIKLAQAAADTAHAITAETPGTFALEANEGVEMKSTKWKLVMDGTEASLGNDKSSVIIDADAAGIGYDFDNGVMFQAAGTEIVGAKIDLTTNGIASVNGSKICLG